MRTLVVSALVASSFLVAAGPAHAGTQFLGWHASGGFHYVLVDDGAGTARVRVCREDAGDIPSGFPEGTNLGPGEVCGDLPAEIGGVKALAYAKQDVKGAKTAKKSPFGLAATLEQKNGKAEVFVSDGPDKRERLGETGAVEPLKIVDTQWRGDGRAVAVVVAPAKPEKGAAPVSTLFVGDVSKLLVGGPAGRKRATSLHTQGQALMKKRDWSGAGKLFDEAIEADPEWAQVRYARAAAEAQGGVGRSAMIENLEWLRDHAEKDAAAKKLLAGAKDDRAFDAWAGEPEVRALLGLPAVDTMTADARLLERKGTWTLQGATCKSPWITLAFKKGDVKKGAPVAITIAESCKGKKTQKAAAATYRAIASPDGAAPPEGAAYVLEVKKPVDGLPATSTIVLDGSYQSFKLQPEAGDPVGAFEPGAARIDDSTL